MIRTSRVVCPRSLVAALVGDGVIAWDGPIIEHDPGQQAMSVLVEHRDLHGPDTFTHTPMSR